MAIWKPKPKPIVRKAVGVFQVVQSYKGQSQMNVNTINGTKLSGKAFRTLDAFYDSFSDNTNTNQDNNSHTLKKVFK